jgi:hypothetical protein
LLLGHDGDGGAQILELGVETGAREGIRSLIAAVVGRDREGGQVHDLALGGRAGVGFNRGGAPLCFIGALALEGRTFDYKTNERLHKALELKLFEDQKDTIKLTSLVSNVVDKETQAKIDVVKNRLIKNYGYCDICSTDALHFVASIFARGDVKRTQA